MKTFNVFRRDAAHGVCIIKTVNASSYEEAVKSVHLDCINALMFDKTVNPDRIWTTNVWLGRADLGTVVAAGIDPDAEDGDVIVNSAEIFIQEDRCFFPDAGEAEFTKADRALLRKVYMHMHETGLYGDELKNILQEGTQIDSESKLNHVVFEINFSDLNEAAQKEFLRLMGLNSAEEGNFDFVPLAIFEYGRGGDQI